MVTGANPGLVMWEARSIEGTKVNFETSAFQLVQFVPVGGVNDSFRDQSPSVDFRKSENPQPLDF